jgi:hypothetical protein
VEALRDWGVEVRAYEPDGVPWHRHTTPGAWHPKGIMHHHTAGTSKLFTSEATQKAMLRILRRGRPGLPGPLCHLSPAMIPGTTRARVWLVGAGNVNHAGMGSSAVLSAVRVGKYRGAHPGRDETDGNPYFWGLEYMHPGTRVTWPDALLEAGHRAACAICQAQGWSKANWPGSNIEHREWTGRKIDRSWTGDLRAAIRATTQEGTHVALTDADVRRIWLGVKVIENANEPHPDAAPDWTPGDAMGRADTKLDNLRTQLGAQATAITKLAGHVAAVSVQVEKLTAALAERTG